jgi:hypothetical protein
MFDKFTNNGPQKFPTILNKEPIKRPSDVAEAEVISPLQKPVEESEEANRVQVEVEKTVEMLRMTGVYMRNGLGRDRLSSVPTLNLRWAGEGTG